jgi:hypothetical protein
MPTKTAISRGRRLAGPAALVATAGGLAAIAIHDTHWIEWGLLAYAGVVGAAGVGLARRSMSHQVLSRATAWTVLAPSALVTLFSVLSGHAEWTAAALAATSGGALLLARPMLHTSEARAEFAPSSFRRWLLAGATASASAGIITGLFALDGMRWHLDTAIPLLGLALSLLASAIGVVRMRAWGILLGAFTSVVTLIAAAFMHDVAGFAVALATIPGFMLLLPVLIAKRDRARAEASRYTRVSAHVSFDDAPARVRVATGSSESSDSIDSLDDDTEASDDARSASSPPPAARAQA